MTHQVENILNLAVAEDGLVGYQLTSQVFVIKDAVSAINPLGWIHVYRTELGRIDCSLR